MIKIDGAQGEGGGQIVRSSLALSAMTGKAFTLENVRAGRKKPGLLRQHLTAARAVADICNADVEGATIGSGRLVFRPQAINAGDYRFDIGSAGSVILVLQSVLPALLRADGASCVEVTGGTHNPAAPPFDHFEQVYLPVVCSTGPRVEAELYQYGFYPAGGGRVIVAIEPVKKMRGFELVDRIGKPEPFVKAVVSALPESIGRRECDEIRRKTNWPLSSFEVQSVPDPVGPGNAILVKLQFENISEIFTGFGRKGVSAETVARQVLREAESYLESGVPVGEYLADQLLLPAAMAAADGRNSSFRTHVLSEHSRTHIEIIRTFLDVEINVEEVEGGVLVQIRAAGN